MVLDFLNKPFAFQISPVGKSGVFVRAYLYCFFTCGLTSIVLLGINSAFFEGAFGNQLHSTEIYQSDLNPIYLGLMVMLYGPISEELTCRLPMNPTRKNLSVAVLIFLFLTFLPPWHMTYTLIKESMLALVGALVLGALFYVFISKYVSDYIVQTDGKYWVLGLTLFFALLHLFNFSYAAMDNAYVLFAPLFVLPQFIAGYFLAFVRLKMGILPAIFFHMLINLPGGLHILLS